MIVAMCMSHNSNYYYTDLQKTTYMLLNKVKDKVMIIAVVSIPMTMLVLRMTTAAVSTDLLCIIQVLQFGLQSPASFKKKSSAQNKAALLLKDYTERT